MSPDPLHFSSKRSSYYEFAYFNSTFRCRKDVHTYVLVRYAILAAEISSVRTKNSYSGSWSVFKIWLFPKNSKRYVCMVITLLRSTIIFRYVLVDSSSNCGSFQCSSLTRAVNDCLLFLIESVLRHRWLCTQVGRCSGETVN